MLARSSGLGGAARVSGYWVVGLLIFALPTLSACGQSRGPEASAVPGVAVELLFVGDILLDSAPGAEIRSGRDPFAAVADWMEKADISVGNLECPVSLRGSRVDKMFTFRADPATLRTLKSHVDYVSLANNHSGDYGAEALVDTMQHLKEAGIPFFGAGHSLRDAHRAAVVEKAGLRIALLGYDEFFPRWFEAGVDSPGVAWSEDEQVVLDIRQARAEGADVVLPFLHWGWENRREPSERQRELARRMIDAGADAVIGAHPHVTQGAELYRGKPIVYSLGNFVFDLFDNEANQQAWMLRLQVDARGVAAFSTVVVQIDTQGTPRADVKALSPCARRDAANPSQCEGGQYPAP